MFILTKSRDLGRMKHPFSRGNTQGATRKLTQPSAEVQCREQHVAAPHRKGSNTGLFQWLMLVKTLNASKFCPDFKIPAIYTHIACRLLSMIPHVPSFSSLQQQHQSTAVIPTITMCFSGKSSHTLLPYLVGII